MTQPTTVLVADDHVLVRDVLANWLNTLPDMKVVCVCSDAKTAANEAIRLRPDVALLDIDMPGQLSFETARFIRSQLPDTCVIFLSAFFSDRFIEQALAVKAAGYLTKGETPDSVAQAIREVRAGRVCFSPEVRARIIIDTSGVRLAGETRTRSSTLTSREEEMLRYLARAMSRREIAEAMHISVHTVDRHTSNLMDKLDIHNRAGLCRFAISEGLAGV